jgi:hypothetical protein
MLAALLLCGCGGGKETTVTVDARHATEGGAERSSPGGEEDYGRGGAEPSLLPADFERRVVGGSGRGEVGVVVAPLAGGEIRTFGSERPPHAWSTIKPVIAVAVLRARREGALPGGREPTSAERELIARSIEDSDNAAAAQLFEELGPPSQAAAALQQVLRQAGDTTTRVEARVTRPGFSSYGQTVWPLSEEARFYRQLANGCLAGRSDTRMILDDMGSVTELGGAGWGLPVAGFSPLGFKAGWGPEEGSSAYAALQYGIVGEAGGGYVIGIVAQTAGDATGAYATVTTAARRAEAALRGRHGPSGPAPC